MSAIHQGETLTVQLGESGSVGDPIGGLASYTEGQVLVSSSRSYKWNWIFHNRYWIYEIKC